MKSLLVFACLLILSSAIKNPEWESFKTEHNKKYANPTEEAFRMKIFLNNKMAIDQHNQLFEEGKVTFTQGANQFSDLTTQEFKEQMLSGLKMPPLDPSAPIHQYSGVAAPISFDWRTRGCVTRVKDQRGCGACWAFSASGSIESMQCIKTGRQVELSEQQLVDCTYPSGGCGGGWMYDAYQFVMSNGGMTTESAYPYTATDGSCKPIRNPIGATMGSYTMLSQGREDSLRDAVTQQPVAVALDADHPSFWNYKSGIYYEPNCSQNNPTHAMLIVGYGTENGNDFWIVKNSWGTTNFGEAGYIRMSRNRNNNCGISNWAMYPNY